MTDRIKGCWVGFEKDIREDAVEPLVNAILRLKGVAGVTTEKVEPNDYMARQMVKADIYMRLVGTIHDFFDPDKTT